MEGKAARDHQRHRLEELTESPWIRSQESAEPAEYDKPLCASLDGFTLHAATRAGTLDQAGREALLRYVLRPPVAQERVELRPDGLVRITLHRPRPRRGSKGDRGKAPLAGPRSTVLVEPRAAPEGAQ